MLEEKMIIDPVCRMTIDPTTAAASEVVDGKRVYFCSEACRRRFRVNPTAYAAAVVSPSVSGSPQRCSSSGGLDRRRSSPPLLAGAGGAGLLASVILLSFYFGVLTLVSGWEFTVEQFVEWWPYIVTLAIGFGTQVGFFVYLRRAVHGVASGKVLAATGTTSGAAMVACCTHYVVNLLPVLGATGLVSFVGSYQVELFWFGIASNLAGITYIGRRVVSFSYGA